LFDVMPNAAPSNREQPGNHAVGLGIVTVVHVSGPSTDPICRHKAPVPAVVAQITFVAEHKVCTLRHNKWAPIVFIWRIWVALLQKEGLLPARHFLKQLR